MTASVSIVIPAYNHARFLPRAIESVLAQSHPALELIVLDDGSTDETPRILAGYGARFRWEIQANMGQAATLNKGWAMASGELLGYLSADDLLHPEAVARVAAVLEREPSLAGAYPDFAQIDENSGVLRTIVAPEFRYEDMVLRGVCPPGPGALFRRSAYRQAGGWNPALRRIPDYDFWLRVALTGPLRRVAGVLASYRVHAGAQSFSRVDAARADEYLAVADGLLASPGLPAALRARAAAARANALLMAARLHLMSGRAGTALARAAAALRSDPALLLRPRSYRLLASGMLWRLRIAGG